MRKKKCKQINILTPIPTSNVCKLKDDAAVTINVLFYDIGTQRGNIIQCIGVQRRIYVYCQVHIGDAAFVRIDVYFFLFLDMRRRTNECDYIFIICKVAGSMIRRGMKNE
jgi:hypothetical protein